MSSIVEMMEEYWPTFINTWPQILESVIMVFAYLLILLFRSKVTKINENLTVGFKQKMEQITQIDHDMRDFTKFNSEEVKAVLDAAVTKVNSAKDEYLAAHQDVKDLYAKYAQVERIVNIILEEVHSYDTVRNDTGVTEGSSGVEGRQCEISTSNSADEQESDDADGDTELSGDAENGTDSDEDGPLCTGDANESNENC